MDIEKSTRHQKIIGQFGERLVCNWLSRSRFEVTIVDHTGIDIIAYNPSTKKRIGISVKSRTRGKGSESESITILKGKSDRIKLLNACKYFACEPWIAVYVETSEFAELYITSLKNYDKKYNYNTNTWRMGQKYKKLYLKDNKVKYIRIEFKSNNWEWK